MKLSEVSAPNDLHNVSDREGNVLCLWVAPILVRVASFVFGICPGMYIRRQCHVIIGDPKFATGC